MELSSEDKQQEKSHLSEWVMDYDKNTLLNSNPNKTKKEYFLNSCNDYSELRQSYSNTTLKNISINFGFPNTRNTYKYKNSYPLTEVPMFEQRNIFYYDKNFQLFKNKSVSKYGEKKNKNNKSLSQLMRNNKLFSPQHKIITSIKKKKYLNDEEVENIKNSKKNVKNEENEKDVKDVYELEVINQVLYDEDESDGKNKKSSKNSLSGARELENEWGEIEQEIFENEKDKENNLLNSIYVEIEKENGDKQLKVVEITREDKAKKEPCIKIKYTVEDKLCLNGNVQDETAGEELTSNYDRETMKDSGVKSLYYNKNTNSTTTSSVKRHDYSTLKKENVSEILLKQSKSTQNIFTPSDKNKLNFSGSFPSTQNKKISNYKQDFNLSKDKKVDSIKPVKYKFEIEEEISPIKEKRYYKKEITEEKTTKLMDIINDNQEDEGEVEGEVEDQTNKSIEMDQKYFTKDKKVERSPERAEKSPEKEEKSPEKEEKIEVKSRKRKYLEREQEKEKDNIGGANENEELITNKQKNFFKENKEKIKEIEKDNIKEQVIITKEKERANIPDKAPEKEVAEIKEERYIRFRVKDNKEKEPEKKEIILDRNRILTKQKIQEKEIEKEKAKKIYQIIIAHIMKKKQKEKMNKQKEKMNLQKKEIIVEKKEIVEKKDIKDREGIKDKYRKKHLKDEEKDEKEIITKVDINKNKPDNELDNIRDVK